MMKALKGCERTPPCVYCVVRLSFPRPSCEADQRTDTIPCCYLPRSCQGSFSVDSVLGVCGGLKENAPKTIGTIRRCGLGGVGMVSLVGIRHCGGRF